jgi:hypothetical protein
MRSASLPLRVREPGWGVDQLLLPGPGKDSPQVLAGLVGGPAAIGSLVFERALVNPPKKVPDIFALQVLDASSATPLLPFAEGRLVLIAGAPRTGVHAEIALDRGTERRLHNVLQRSRLSCFVLAVRMHRRWPATRVGSLGRFLNRSRRMACPADSRRRFCGTSRGASVRRALTCQRLDRNTPNAISLRRRFRPVPSLMTSAPDQVGFAWFNFRLAHDPRDRPAM